MTSTGLLELFSPSRDPALLHYGTYTPSLVLLSVLMAIFSSWMSLQMAAQARASSNQWLRIATLSGASLALGYGVWSMHFIGMLAFNLCTNVEYDPVLTLLSVLPSLAASSVVVTIISRQDVSPWSLLGGGMLVGGGIGTMHYSGMAAMQLSLDQRYDPWMFSLSIVVAIVLATLALWVRFGLRKADGLSKRMKITISATTMGCAIAGMHYIGMEAVHFVGHLPPGNTPGQSSTFLALTLSLTTLILTISVLSANGLLRYHELFLQLSKSESWMRALLTTTIDGIITVDADGTIFEYNASAERIFGWSRADIIGRNIRLLMADPERPEQGSAFDYLRTAITDANREMMAVRQDGTLVPIRCAIGHARQAKDELFVLFITDISERRTIMQALRDSEQQFRSLIGNIPGISFRTSAETGFPLVFISDGVERVAGYAAADFLPPQARRTLADLIIPSDYPRVAAGLMQAVKQASSYQIEYRLHHADGSLHWMWENGAATRDEDSSTVRWIDGVILDISERRQMEEELREAKEKAERAAAARSIFVANMSHEIRTPMNAILGFTDVLLDTPLNADQRRYLDTVRSQGRALLRLLNEILDKAKLDKGAVELELADYNLLALVEELSSTYGNNASSKGLTLDTLYDPQLPTWLHGDELRMRQVLCNLLDNAIKFSSVGQINLEVSKHDQQLHIKVKDTGIGIAPERLEAIFDPFTQADASMTRRYGGTGLGTTISKQLVELMGGRIWATSGQGVGTTFYITLPLVAAHGNPEYGSLEQSHQTRELPPLHILVADDVPQNLELLELMLHKHGHSLETAADGAEAVQMAAATRFDLILMDLQMPQLDGLEATRAIRAAEKAAGLEPVPIVAMTASVLNTHREASIAAGMQGFASKPVDWNSLLQEITRVLNLQTDHAAPAPTAASHQHILNRKASLDRWSGDEHIYQQALERFAADYNNAATTLTAKLAAGDLASAHADCHRIRGIAANLGLEQLAAVLAALEQWCAIAPGQTAPALESAPLPALREALQAALPALQRTAPVTTNDPDTASPLDTSAALTAGAALIESLQHGALDNAALTALTASLGKHADLAQVQRALDDFDFPLAVSKLQTLLDNLTRS
ncbi:MAG: MHYT domain-containing protein [Herbaspirillum sp.]